MCSGGWNRLPDTHDVGAARINQRGFEVHEYITQRSEVGMRGDQPVHMFLVTARHDDLR